MRLVITAEHHFVVTPDGAYWGPDSMTYDFWSRYLDVFDEVTVVVRVQPVATATSQYSQLSGPGVGVVPLPEYVGPREYLRVRRAFANAAASAVQPGDAVLLRVGCSPVAARVESGLWRQKRPFGVEVITDPYMVFAPGAIRHPLRPVFRQMFTRQLRRQCARAVAATYVTQHSLQQRYPANPNAFSTFYSDVNLPPEAFVASPRVDHPIDSSPTVVSIGSMAQLYKGFDVLIDAVALCHRQGTKVNLVLVGDGRHRPELEQRARDREIAAFVSFVGQIPGGAPIREQLDRADLFVLASRTEGLPRVVIEAQARGLPCVGTTVGGIPELLDESQRVPPENASALADRMMAILRDPVRQADASARNLAVATAYGLAAMTAKRQEFLRELRDRTVAAQSHVTVNVR